MDAVPHTLDPETEELARCASMIRGDYLNEGIDIWINSPFAWIRSRQSRQRGAIIEKLVSSWCAAKGFDVTKSPDTDADRVIEGRRVEIKGSTLWESGVYKFQQIRDQNYDYLFALGISPFDAHAWVIPKEVLMEPAEGITHQHGGARGRDTRWLSCKPGEEYEWMKQYGGTLGNVRSIIASFPQSNMER